MLRLILSPDATQDLDDIWDYIATNNQSAANKVIDEIPRSSSYFDKCPKLGVRAPNCKWACGVFR